jgi:transcriptional regulator with XRE-family HTH domain
LTFQDAQQRLLAYVWDRIHNGELTERGFARMIGISQPHAHNVLKGVRNLSIEISDFILKIFHISLLDLAPLEELESNLKRRKALEPVLELPFLDTRVGPGFPWPARIDWNQRLPAPFQAAAPPPGLVVARLAKDPHMHPTLSRFDIAILDTSPRHRADPSPEGLYAVQRGGEALIRRLRPGARCYYLVTDTTLQSPQQWEQLSISSSELPEFVKARVLWLGREKDRDLPMHQRGRFLYDVISW